MGEGSCRQIGFTAAVTDSNGDPEALQNVVSNWIVDSSPETIWSNCFYQLKGRRQFDLSSFQFACLWSVCSPLRILYFPGRGTVSWCFAGAEAEIPIHNYPQKTKIQCDQEICQICSDCEQCFSFKSQIRRWMQQLNVWLCAAWQKKLNLYKAS